VLIVIRHGQTASNASGLLLGRGDPPLNELGRRQAEALAGIAGVAGAVTVVSSPLRRCQETAGLLHRPVRVDERWIEIDYGDYEGTPLGDVPAEVWAKWRTEVSWAPPGGESLAAVGIRVRAACEDLAEQAAHSDVVVVSHVSPIKAAVAWALGVGDAVAWRMFLDVAAVCRIAVGPLGPSLRSYNETHHRPDGSQEART
jgi:broad specificity phosphatase PhoE